MVPKYLVDAAEDVDKALRAKGAERYLAVARALASSCDALKSLAEDLERHDSKTSSAFEHLRTLQQRKLDEYRDGFNELLYRLAEFERSVLASAGVSPQLIDNILNDSQALVVSPNASIPSPKELASELRGSDLVHAVCKEKDRLESSQQSENLLKRSADVLIGTVTAVANGSVDAALTASGMTVPGVITILSGHWGVERIKRGFKGKQ
ncbi:MAG: hypothetical protein ABJA83_13635 [Burkholderiaceae bacterium]